MVKSTLALASLLSIAAQARTVDRVVAVVNDDIVLDSEVDQIALAQVRGNLNLSSPEAKKQFDELRKKSLDTLIDSALMKQAAAELKLTGRRKALARAFDEVREQIRNRLFRDKRQDAMETFVKGLREKASVKIDEAKLAAVKIDSTQPGQFPGPGVPPPGLGQFHPGAPAVPGASPITPGAPPGSQGITLPPPGSQQKTDPNGPGAVAPTPNAPPPAPAN